MKMFYILLLVGLVGYIAYPFLPPKLLGISKREADDSSDPVRETEVKLVGVCFFPMFFNLALVLLRGCPSDR